MRLDLDKMKMQAFEQGKPQSVLAFKFSPWENKSYYVLDETQFLLFLNYMEGYYD